MVTALPPCTDGVQVLRVAGEIDLSTLEQLRGRLDRYVCGAYRGVVLDFTAVSFLAACGVGALFEFAEVARAKGMTVRLVAHHPIVLRALEVIGTDGLVPRAATVAEAVAQCSI